MGKPWPFPGKQKDEGSAPMKKGAPKHPDAALVISFGSKKADAPEKGGDEANPAFGGGGGGGDGMDEKKSCGFRDASAVCANCTHYNMSGKCDKHSFTVEADDGCDDFCDEEEASETPEEEAAEDEAQE